MQKGDTPPLILQIALLASLVDDNGVDEQNTKFNSSSLCVCMINDNSVHVYGKYGGVHMYEKYDSVHI